ncbi:uL15 family ribosomal protein [Candidatus Vidania fulgoroideae]|nr:uL15 family ribosomal protein [Candidatus Vidania fulgoroideae]
MKAKRIGRGNSSKKGNTAGRGNKGQKSRSGYSKRRFFIGGQTPTNILRPKFGFKGKVKTNNYKNLQFNKNNKLIIFNKTITSNKKLLVEMTGGNVCK